MKHLFHHLFTPHVSNNFRAKILHNGNLIYIIVLLSFFSISMNTLKENFPQVLGVSTNISIEQLLEVTNQERSKENLPPLVLNTDLNKAALSKAEHMLNHNYWAHNAPDGTTPWVFIKQSGYSYNYAGENLARGFTKASDIVDAWMASPTHRNNMLSSNYDDIGFAVMDGKLLGEDTVLVVEMFGRKIDSQIVGKEINTQQDKLIQNAFPQKQTIGVSVKNNPLIDSSFVVNNIAIYFVILFILVLFLDMIIIERKKVVRFVGHNLDHIFFFSGILVIILIFTKGSIL